MTVGLEEFNAHLTALARAAGDAAWNPSVGLVAEQATYKPVHTLIWTGIRHDHRESVIYALALLESGEVDRAEQILTTIAAKQDTDPDSDTYGVWSYYDEETLAQMDRPDFNWADFIGRDLAFILLRHSDRLSDQVRETTRAALGHAARSIIRRNVAMSYTNIAAKGTFVTLAAGQILGDTEIFDYGLHRLERLQTQIRESGGFAEYNSPTYWVVTLEAITAIGQFIDHPDAVEKSRWIADLLWRHFANRWHRPTGQVSGPVARAYFNDLAEHHAVLAILAKATNLAEPFDAEIVRQPQPTSPVQAVWLAAVSILDFQAPASVVDDILAIRTGVLTERFNVVQLPSGGKHSLYGTTWNGETATVGSVNTSEFWYQRRPIFGFWTEPGDELWKQNRYVRLKFLKDDFDFCSAMFNSVQAGSHILWTTGFVSPAGDRHIHIPKIEAGQAFEAESLRLIFEFGGAENAKVSVADRPVTETTPFDLGDAVVVESGAVRMTITTIDGVFGKFAPTLSVSREDDLIRVQVELLPPGGHTLTLLDIDQAYLCGTFSMTEDSSEATSAPALAEVVDGAVRATWQTPGGDHLTLRAPAGVGDVMAYLEAFASTVNGSPVNAQPLA